jgi:hypothetical protein
MTMTVQNRWPATQDIGTTALYALLDQIDEELADQTWMTGDSKVSPMGPRHRATRVLGVSGSLRQASFNRRLLDLARSLAPGGVEIMVWDGLKSVPPFDEDDEVDPPLAVDA